MIFEDLLMKEGRKEGKICIFGARGHSQYLSKLKEGGVDGRDNSSCRV